MQRNCFFGAHRELMMAILLCCPVNASADNTWSYKQENDRLNNQSYSFALSPMPRRDLYDELKLEIICKDRSLQVAIDAESLIASQGSKFDVEYQIDKQAPVNIQMQTFPDSKRRGFTIDDAKPLIDAILSGQEAIFIRVKTMIREVLSGSIPLQDAGKPIRQVLADCGISASADKDSNPNYSMADFEQDFNKLSSAQQQQVMGQIKKILMELQ